MCERAEIEQDVDVHVEVDEDEGRVETTQLENRRDEAETTLTRHQMLLAHDAPRSTTWLAADKGSLKATFMFTI